MEDKPKFDKKAYDREFTKNNYDKFTLTLPKGGKQAIRDIAHLNNESANTLIVRAIDKEIEEIKGNLAKIKKSC